MGSSIPGSHLSATMAIAYAKLGNLHGLGSKQFREDIDVDSGTSGSRTNTSLYKRGAIEGLGFICMCWRMHKVAVLELH